MGEIRKPWFRRVGSSISQFANVFFFNGHPDESISACAWRTRTLWAISLIERVFGKGHCQRAYATDIAHAKTLLGV